MTNDGKSRCMMAKKKFQLIQTSNRYNYIHVPRKQQLYYSLGINSVFLEFQN